ncbi:MATE family efflux transporter [Aquisalinus flavus]|uniref:Multidrug-efflux transporter n=1 Tax=Aquisalinus flavus TaxID=1526572 RepID=A0A8J2V0W1_9PROT|nr:MATE family efflux transporter [Aquisalinus flavus]MBD0426754.1 MATE family efflux transporter [Aquisalinus flavus]UNE46611.1 MATE family efflux transporter [Aquisalinus flavus]GGC95729.1 MATE family efflux transporter [Aquisalinus flavus]
MDHQEREEEGTSQEASGQVKRRLALFSVAPGSDWLVELGATLRLAWPLIIAQLAQMAIFTTDTLMMGWLGPEYLATGTLAVAYLHPLFVFGLGLLFALSPMMAQALGARQFRNVRRTARQGFWAALAMSAVIIPILWQVRPLLGLTGQTEATLAMAEIYVHTAVFSIIPMLLFVVLRTLVSVHGETRIVLIITLSGIAVNALGNYTLMFGNFGAPRLELLGAAISTVTVNTVMLLLLLAYVQLRRRFRRYHIFARFWRPDWQRFRQIFTLGSPIGLQSMAEVGLFAAAAMMMGRIGTDELAAHAIALQLAALAFMIPFGLSQATTIRVGLAAGEGRRAGIGIAGWASYLVAMTVMSMTALIFWQMPKPLIHLFLNPAAPENAVPIALAVGYLGVAALFQLVDGAQVVAGAALRGLSDTTVPMVIALIGYWLVGMPLSYWLGFHTPLEGMGVWYGLAAGLAVVAVVLTGRFILRERFGLVS